MNVLLKNKNLCDPGKFMRHKRSPTNKVTHPGLMSLKNGKVWVGCPDPSCDDMIAIKKTVPHEIIVQKEMHSHFPDVVPAVYAFPQCFDGIYMYSEYVKGGSLKSNITEDLVLKVFKTLRRVHKKFPSFRHNDLHVDNVLVKNGVPQLYDFELSNWHGNPIFDNVFKQDYGIYVGNSPMYDFHFFTISIVSEAPKKFKKTALSVFPPEYLVENSSVCKNWRLRSDVAHKKLPTMDQVIDAFSSLVYKNKRSMGKLLTFASATEKKTTVAPSIMISKKNAVVKFSAKNKERAAMRKIELVRQGMNNVQAELKAIKDIETLKRAGLLTPTPSPVKKVPPPRVSPRVKITVSVSKTGKGKHVRFSPVATVVKAAVAGPSRPAPVVVFTETPRRRPRIDAKLCSSYKKDELMNFMRRLGHRVNKHMSIKEMCLKLRAPTTSKYTRPANVSILNARKVTYPTLLRKNLFRLGKTVGAGVSYKNKKGQIVNKLYAKLNKNAMSVLGVSNKKTITTRQIAEKLAKNYGWRNDRAVERLRLLKIYKNFTK